MANRDCENEITGIIYVLMYFLVPEDVCLLGCIFYIADYQKYLEHTTLDVWRQVVTLSNLLYSTSSLCYYGRPA